MNISINFIHTPGHAPLAITTEPYILHLIGKLPDYELHEYFDKSFHLVHKNYVRYTVKVLGSYKKYAFTKNDALIAYREAINECPYSIIELWATDWIGKVVEYTWFKRHKYAPFHPLKTLKKIKLRQHPFIQYEYQS